MSFRFELKFALRKENIPELKNYLDKLKIVKNFSPRLINSIYFDNNKYQSFEDSEEGISPRKKIRLRYYNNDKNLIFFEKKINSYEGRFKESNSINLIEYKKKLKFYYDDNYKFCKPIIEINYFREYFYNKSFRINIDTNINIKKFNNGTVQKLPDVVFEAKCQKKSELVELLNLFQHTQLRFSKYCKAFKALEIKRC